jgi:membrane-associated phospholipid phosphatase
VAVRVWDKNIAAVISLIASPPVLVIVAMAIQARQSFEPGVWNWLWFYSLLAVIVPLAYLVQLVSRGRVSDIDIESREERFSPLGVTVGCMGIAWLVLYMRSAPSPMTVLAGVLFAQTSIIFVVTFFWKISVHCASAGLVGILAGGLAGSAVPAVVTVTLMSWSRWRLDQHTPAQAVAGTLLGVLSSVAVAVLVQGRM